VRHHGRRRSCQQRIVATTRRDVGIESARANGSGKGPGVMPSRHQYCRWPWRIAGAVIPRLQTSITDWGTSIHFRALRNAIRGLLWVVFFFFFWFVFFWIFAPHAREYGGDRDRIRRRGASGVAIW